MKIQIAGLIMILAAAAAAQTPAEKLAAHAAGFKQEVVEVAEGVHVALGYGLANAILVEGADGVLIVDTMESPVTAGEVKKAFDAITVKPVKGIVYTHFHADHIGGAGVFAGEGAPAVYAHEDTDHLVEEAKGPIAQIIRTRSIRQFGLGLPEELQISGGIGLKLSPSVGMQPKYLAPAVTLDAERASYEVAGIKFDLVKAPGETDDQIYVWLPEKKVLLCGDNYYNAFPNLYAIRGTSYRDVRGWAESLEKMLAEGAEALVPSHTGPIIGAEAVRETLTNYRDAIRHVHDETVKGMNAGKTPDELAASIALPEHLGGLPYLQEYYGTVAWSVRSIYNGYLGWFDGNATNLYPLGVRQRAERTAKLAGGKDKLLAAAQQALAEGDAQWAAELTDLLLALEHEVPVVKALKAEALTVLGKEQISANGRNYYLVSAEQLKR
ncbi:MAG: alkyl/aryl-sulfatase [Candidatus Hydrogenedentes bacterium]|nr:alkyl/aryl-sulfatase [Candidatus Hydrogenedentota bacterium]